MMIFENKFVLDKILDFNVLDTHTPDVLENWSLEHLSLDTDNRGQTGTERCTHSVTTKRANVTRLLSRI